MKGLDDGTLRIYPDFIVMVTLEGSMVVMPGDWIILESYGLFHPCGAKIFEQLYELVDIDPG